MPVIVVADESCRSALHHHQADQYTWPHTGRRRWMHTSSGDEQELDRNPSPPREEGGDLLRADSIGDTVFSKHWVFTTLMKLLKAVESEEKSQSQADREESKMLGIEIDSDLENDLCKLWDMTANEDVALFLEEWKSPDILINVIAKTNAPRVTEICMGILGNMVCSGSISVSLSKNKDLVAMVLSILSSRDPPTLVETCRFINSALSHPGSADRWLSAIREDEEVFQNLAFILQSSTNNDLIHNTVDLVDLILDSCDVIAEKWSSPSLLDGLVEAFKQARSERRATIPVILHAIQLISTTSLGVDSLVKVNESILPLLAQYICDVCEEEVIVISGKEKALASSVIVIRTLLATPGKLAEHLKTEKQLFRHLLKILCITQEKSKETAPNKNNDSIVGAEREKLEESKVDGEDKSLDEVKEDVPNGGAAGDSRATHDATVADPATGDPTMELLLSSLVSFAQMVLDLSEKEDDVRELLQDKFEEGKDTTCLEKLREVLDSS